MGGYECMSFGSFSLRELTCMHCVYLALCTRKVLCGSFLCAIYKFSFIRSFIYIIAVFRSRADLLLRVVPACSGSSSSNTTTGVGSSGSSNSSSNSGGADSGGGGWGGGYSASSGRFG